MRDGTEKFSAEQIVGKLREADVMLGQGLTVAQACKWLEVIDKVYDRWRKEYGGTKVDQAKRLKEFEPENARLKHLLAEVCLDKQMLQEIAGGNGEPAPQA